MNLILFIICVVIAGIIMGGGVHFIPVGGAPAAMATATGVGTGTAMLAAGAGRFHVNDGYHHAYW